MLRIRAFSIRFKLRPELKQVASTWPGFDLEGSRFRIKTECKDWEDIVYVGW